MAKVKQVVSKKLRAKNKKAKFKMSFKYSQSTKLKNLDTTNSFSYSKGISKKSNLSYR